MDGMLPLMLSEGGAVIDPGRSKVKARRNSKSSRSAESHRRIRESLGEATEIPTAVSEIEVLAVQGRRLGFLIHDVSRMRRSAFDHLMRPLMVTRSRWWVLAQLARIDGMVQSQLADVLDTGKSSLGTVIEHLEKLGWVERRADRADRRNKRVFLSKSVQPFIKRMAQEEDRFNEKILSRLNSNDRKLLIELLSRIKESLALVAVPNDADMDAEDRGSH